jgi:hypothetical protein
VTPELVATRWIRVDIGHMVHRLREHGLLGRKARDGSVRGPESFGSGGGASRGASPGRCHADQLSIVSDDCHPPRVEQTHGAVGDGVEDRLHVCRRARDDLEDLTRRRQVAVARRQLIEQLDVLDRDDGLVGKSLEQADLGVREWPRRGLPNRDYSNRVPGMQHRHRHETTETARASALGVVRWVFEDVGDVHYGSAQHSAAGPPAVVWPHGVHRTRPVQALAGPVVGCDEMQELTVEPLKVTLHGVAESRGAPDDRVEDRLHIGGRAADDTQDPARRGLLVKRLLGFVEQPHVLDGDDGLVGKGLE